MLGPFKEHIEGHIALKQALGYSYIVAIPILEEFDRFTFDKYPFADEITREIAIDWCSRKPHETQSSQGMRASVVRQLSKYIVSLDIPAYIVPDGYYTRGTQYSPYIYSDAEITDFFKVADIYKRDSQKIFDRYIVPLFFRVLYTCGLRCKEARVLKISDVDVESGIITINKSKNNNSRLIPVSDELKQAINEYYFTVHQSQQQHEYFFPDRKGEPVTESKMYGVFRLLLWQADISHGGKGKGPRMHDFRHTFAVKCLKKWVEQGKNLDAYLPILRTYMGHYSFKETAYYLRMTAEVFPNILITLEKAYAGIIPELEVSE